MQPKPVAFTPGEPAGIGLDLAVLFAQQEQRQIVVAYADPDLISQRAEKLGRKIRPIPVGNQLPKKPAGLQELYVKPVKAAEPVRPGYLNVNNVPYVLRCIELAVKDCELQKCSALVTGPIHKGIINQFGIAFTGHTEFLAELTSGKPVMMLACPGLRVALVTTHLPLRQVADAVNKETLLEIVQVLHAELQQKFGLDNPRILVCGLNPHAGEDGHLGKEELEQINPALKKLRRSQGMDLIGPLPADTVFTPKYMAQADAVLAMYHDQGLPVLKHMGFGRAVNITLGLPIIRTSVDHGTALDLAGTGSAETGSLLEAIRIASEMAYTLNRK